MSRKRGSHKSTNYLRRSKYCTILFLLITNFRIHNVTTPQLFNQIYVEVIKLGAFYEIKESAGASSIKISVENKKTLKETKSRDLTP